MAIAVVVVTGSALGFGNRALPFVRGELGATRDVASVGTSEGVSSLRLLLLNEVGGG